MTLKKKIWKNLKRCQKTQNFTLISNPLKKFWKNLQKKVISKNETEKCTFFTFTHVRQTCFAYNFFWRIFSQRFQRIQNQREILRFFYTFFDKKKKNFMSYLYFFQTLKPNAQETYLVNVS